MFDRAQSSLSVCTSIITISALDATSNPYLDDGAQTPRLDSERTPNPIGKLRKPVQVVSASAVVPARSDMLPSALATGSSSASPPVGGHTTNAECAGDCVLNQGTA